MTYGLKHSYAAQVKTIVLDVVVVVAVVVVEFVDVTVVAVVVVVLVSVVVVSFIVVVVAVVVKVHGGIKAHIDPRTVEGRSSNVEQKTQRQRVPLIEAAIARHHAEANYVRSYNRAKTV
eukprot:CAMPEP_0169367170 /NCGR_PEP_ID=MMETSP1017-20121227/33521_1 /TAXON_ID=342587 /ORGANISM="Karlodinium micrum, Strain CCMP2283" /LENGTH=118 /DNA_ID=CAMNT_0009465183 /DNA_START=679 /DNA_END=1032 /DNA_ORIENTATION=-